MTTKQQVAKATNLKALRDALNAFEPSSEFEKLGDIVNLSALPTFGGVDPIRTDDVWSWDAENVLLHDNGQYYIERRDLDAWYDSGKDI